MDKPSFLVFSFIGMMSMVILHLSEVWLFGSGTSLTEFLLEWFPLYLVWMSMLFIGLFKRASE
ncbi:hypothetical protein MD588_04850 [Photobacterium sp. SDRW27]|uniref:hypothetical protein n=1 Tax=Photobacterium obscurum TaxID=2829490 RepID=UPI0022440AC5|nr:hypothetical protein [Photobacterium obscurum]MCW8328131.1 hypothetical protein [Photobacterium obscurum]